MEKIKLGISTCLLRERVRYDGGHKLDRFLRDTLGKYVEYIHVCPEVGKTKLLRFKFLEGPGQLPIQGKRR